MGQQPINLNRHYGLLNNEQLQATWLSQAAQQNVLWHQAKAMEIEHSATGSTVTTDQGQTLTARLVIDASGHHSPFVQRSQGVPVAYQAAYGIVGRFSQPPISPGQMVLMDYRDDHLSPADRAAPPTFLYGMDLGDDVYFVEETSLAHCPAIALEDLKKRLYQRLAQRQITVTEVHHIERCLFPMNLPLPDRSQPVLGFGGAASMVHPASGYMIGAILRRGPDLVRAIAQALNQAESTPEQLAKSGWQALWSPARLRKNHLYRFGLRNLMSWDNRQLQRFFATFFSLKTSHWSDFLADTLSLPELVGVMLLLFRQAPNDIRWELMRSVVLRF
jgi:lycopene beta-cyclase